MARSLRRTWSWWRRGWSCCPPRLVDIEQSLKGQGASIESARTAMSQTDDLVERVVEALESLQTAMQDADEGGERSNLAIH